MKETEKKTMLKGYAGTIARVDLTREKVSHGPNRELGQDSSHAFIKFSLVMKSDRLCAPRHDGLQPFRSQIRKDQP
jgi:hypothetical protein